MRFKYKEQEIDVPDDFIVKCGQHAEQRGMTLEEYISEAFTKTKKEEQIKLIYKIILIIFFII